MRASIDSIFGGCSTGPSPYLSQRTLDDAAKVQAAFDKLEAAKAAAKEAARSESVANRALRDGTTFANLEYATNWTPERFKQALAVICGIGAKVHPGSDVSALLDEASDLLDVTAEPDADPRHTLREEEHMERARESRA